MIYPAGISASFDFQTVHASLAVPVAINFCRATPHEQILLIPRLSQYRTTPGDTKWIVSCGAVERTRPRGQIRSLTVATITLARRRPSLALNNPRRLLMSGPRNPHLSVVYSAPTSAHAHHRPPPSHSPPPPLYPIDQQALPSRLENSRF